MFHEYFLSSKNGPNFANRPEGHCGHFSKIPNLRRLMTRNHRDAMSENGGRSRSDITMKECGALCTDVAKKPQNDN